jgi:hypothetical protein
MTPTLVRNRPPRQRKQRPGPGFSADGVPVVQGGQATQAEGACGP